MLTPKNIKYRIPHQRFLKRHAASGRFVSFGNYGIQSLQQACFISRQIETRRRILVRYVRRNGKLWIRVFPDKIITRRPAETRIGSCKGNLRYWVAIICSGQVLFELSGISLHVARQAIKIVASKIQFKVELIEKGNSLREK